MNPRWIFQEVNEFKARELAEKTGVSLILSRLAILRGIETPKELIAFLNPGSTKFHDPFLMKDMAKAVRRIKKALIQKEKILSLHQIL
jgi:single-stranded-DNA-specific exonuclease